MNTASLWRLCKLSLIVAALAAKEIITMPATQYPAGMPAFFHGTQQGTAAYDAQVARAVYGKHRIKNDVVKLNSNYVQKYAADRAYRDAHPDAYLTANQTNPTPGSGNGGGSAGGQQTRRSTSSGNQAAGGRPTRTVTNSAPSTQAQSPWLMPAYSAPAFQTPQPMPTSDRRDTTSDARSNGAPTYSSPFPTSTVPGWLSPQQRTAAPSGPGVSPIPAFTPPTLPAAPRIPSGIPPVTIPSGIPARNIPANIPAPASYAPARPAPARTPAIPAGVTPGGNWGPTNGAYNVYFDPNGKRYMVTADGRFIPSVVNQRTLTGQPNAYGEAYDQAALARLAYARAMSNYLQPLSSSPSTFGSYYGGGFGGGYGGGGGGGYTSYDPYNSNPSWYNSLDLTAWNIQ